MTSIPAGYRLAILDEHGTVLDSASIGGYNLYRPIDRAQIAGLVECAVIRAQASTPVTFDAAVLRG